MRGVRSATRRTTAAVVQPGMQATRLPNSPSDRSSSGRAPATTVIALVASPTPPKAEARRQTASMFARLLGMKLPGTRTTCDAEGGDASC